MSETGATIPRRARIAAGRELDALVAERVMGAEWTDHGRGVRVLVLPNRLHAVTEIDGVAKVNPACPCYSTHIAAAWDVVEKLTGFVRERDEPWWSFAVFNAQRNQVGAAVYACRPGWRIDNTATQIAFDVGSAAPEAICRAALLALELSSDATGPQAPSSDETR